MRIEAVPASIKGGLLKAIIKMMPITEPGITYGLIRMKSRTAVRFDFLRTIT